MTQFTSGNQNYSRVVHSCEYQRECTEKREFSVRVVAQFNECLKVIPYCSFCPKVVKKSIFKYIHRFCGGREACVLDQTGY